MRAYPLASYLGKSSSIVASSPMAPTRRAWTPSNISTVRELTPEWRTTPIREFNSSTVP